MGECENFLDEAFLGALFGGSAWGDVNTKGFDNGKGCCEVDVADGLFAGGEGSSAWKKVFEDGVAGSLNFGWNKDGHDSDDLRDGCLVNCIGDGEEGLDLVQRIDWEELGPGEQVFQNGLCAVEGWGILELQSGPD